MLLILIFVCNYSIAQTKELQQTIDSFKTVLNEQNLRINRLEYQVHGLYKVLNSVKKGLNDSSFSQNGKYTNLLFENRPCNANIDSIPCRRMAQKGSEYCRYHQSVKNRIKSTSNNPGKTKTNNGIINLKSKSKSSLNEKNNQKGPRGGKYLKTKNGRKYFVMSNGRQYVVMPNGRISWVHE